MPLTISSPILEALARRKAQQEALRQQGAGAIGMLGGGIAAGQEAQDKAQQQANADRVALRLENEAQAARAQEAVTNRRNAAADARAGTELQLRLAQDARAADAAAKADARAQAEQDRKGAAAERAQAGGVLGDVVRSGLANGLSRDKILEQARGMPALGALTGDEEVDAEIARQMQEQADRDLAERTALAGIDAKQAAAEKARRKPAAADPSKAGSKGAKGEDALRKEFNALPEVKQFNEATVAKEILERATSDPSPAGDLSLIYGYMKILDPESVVKNNEASMVQQAGDFGDQVQNLVTRVVSGERLTPAQRQDLVRQATTIYNGRRTTYDAAAQRYGGIVQRRGLTQENVLPSGAAPAPAATATPSEARAKMDAWAGG